MKLESLKLSNFRGFRSFEIAFDPSFTALVGGNMAGKTAVLDAAAFVLRRLLGAAQAREFDDDEIYQLTLVSGGVPGLHPQFPVSVEAKIAAEWLSNGWDLWRFVREQADGPTRPDHSPYTLLNSPSNEDLPILAYYGAQRHWDRKQPADDVRGLGARYDGYAGAFDVRSTHGAMAGWTRKQTFVQLQQGNGYRQPQLAAVEAAVKSCMGDVTRFWFDVQYDELRLERGDGDLQSFAMLSEGYRNMVAMIADIAWRASVLNPHHGADAPLRTEGIVLIDELDLHLHPAWQRRIVGDLVRTFPKLQFIVTTHSPQIIASATRTQIRLLDNNRLIAEEPHVEGRDTNALLEDVFGVPSRPEGVQSRIDELFRLLEDEDYQAARARLAALRDQLGPDDAAVIQATWILDTEDPPSGTESLPPP